MFDANRPFAITSLPMMTIVLLTVGVFILENAAQAQEQQWTNPTGGDFSVATNWDTDVPDDTEDARFVLDATYGINLTADHSIAGFLQDRGNITLSGGFALNVLAPSNIYDGTLNLSGTGTQFNQTGEFAVGRDGGNAHLNVLSGASLSTVVGRLGYTSDATGSVLIDGAGSQWLVDSNLIVGRGGTGNLRVQNGGQVTSGNGISVGSSGSLGSVVVSGVGSNLVSSSNTSQVGTTGTGSMLIENQAAATFANQILGGSATGNGTVTIDGTGSNWNVTGSTTVGGSGTGSLEVRNGGTASTGSILNLGTSDTGSGTVNVNSGGTLVSNLSRIGFRAGSTGEVNVRGADAQWNVTNQLFIGDAGTGTVSITEGAKVDVAVNARIGNNSSSVGSLTISGTGSELTTNALDVAYLGQGNLNISEGGMLTSQSANIGRLGNNGVAVVDGTGSRWDAGNFNIGSEGAGLLTVSNGGVVTAIGTNVARSSGSNGSLVVTGSGSQFSTDTFVAGGASTGAVMVEQGGLLQTTGFTSLGSTGTAIVRGTDSRWLNESDVQISGSLRIESGGSFTSGITYIGPSNNTDGTVVVTGTGSSWTSNLSLAVGRIGSGRLEILNGGLVSNQGTGVGFGGGTGSLLVDGTGSQLATNSIEVGFDGDGSVTIRGGATVDSAVSSIYSNEMGSQSEVTVTGNGSQFNSSASLQIGLGSTRSGALSISDGGLVNVGGSTWIDGLGTLSMNQGELVSANRVENLGLIQITGDSVLSGGIELSGNGRIETLSSALAVVNGNVVLQNSEIFTELGSSIRFNDTIQGPGVFTGLGAVEFDGHFNHGNASMIADFAGDASFLSNSLLSIELGGTSSDAFDQLFVAGDLSLDGDLAVSLVGGFELTAGMEFLFADVGGTLSGQFSGLGENALVGNYGGTDLYISYSGGDGNDVRMFTTSAVPEPSSAAILLLICIGATIGRNRRQIQLN